MSASTANRPAFRVALRSGGDERLSIDPQTGRNRYGVAERATVGEIAFASSTASPLSQRGRNAAATAYADLLGGRSPANWTEALRERLQEHFGIPGSEVVLAGSGTEAELVVLTLAGALLGPGITNIVLAPPETGSGVMLAAGGRNFLGSASCAPEVIKGAMLDGLAECDVTVEGVAIRNSGGEPLTADVVDAAAANRVAAAMRAGRRVLLHCLDTSKTGLAGLRRTTAAALAATYPGRVVVIVDACQLRCSADEIRRDLAAGFFVLVTGSKFLGGPPFAGAVLVPPCAVARLRQIAIPSGLADYSAEHDWPQRLRARMIERPFGTAVNIGLGLRWAAALAELNALAAHPSSLQRKVVAELGAMIRTAVTNIPGLMLIEGGTTALDRLPTIFPVVTHSPCGAALCAKTLHRGLMDPARTVGSAHGRGRVFHIGQPVAIGPVSALRVCIGAPQIVAVADRLQMGEPMRTATRTFAADLAALFAKWAGLQAEMISICQVT